MKYCPKCTIDLAESDRFCRSCGGPVTDKPMMAETQAVTESASRCPNCGAAAKPGWKACSQCGFQLQAAQAAAPQVQQAVPVNWAAPPAAGGSQAICRVCGKANRAGMRFCEGC